MPGVRYLMPRAFVLRSSWFVCIFPIRKLLLVQISEGFRKLDTLINNFRWSVSVEVRLYKRQLSSYVKHFERLISVNHRSSTISVGFVDLTLIAVWSALPRGLIYHRLQKLTYICIRRLKGRLVRSVWECLEMSGNKHIWYLIFFHSWTSCCGTRWWEQESRMSIYPFLEENYAS